MSENRNLHIWLDRQADRVEHVLSALALPARVSGGKVSERGVEYRLRPMLGTEAQALMDAAGEIAQDIGVREVRTTYAQDEVALQIPSQPPDALLLLPLMRSLGDLDPLTAVLGREMDRRPASVSLGRSKWTHVMVAGGNGSGKSDLLRSAMISLALTSHRSQLALQAIDIGGQQLPMVEALPHSRAALAANLGAAESMIAGLEIETRHRRAKGISAPHIAVFIDGVAWLGRDRRQRALRSLLGLLALGRSAGVHVFAALRTPASQRLSPLHSYLGAKGVYSLRAMELRRQGGHLFEIESRRPPAAMQVAGLSAAEIDRAVKLIAPPRAGESHERDGRGGSQRWGTSLRGRVAH